MSIFYSLLRQQFLFILGKRFSNFIFWGKFLKKKINSSVRRCIFPRKWVKLTQSELFSIFKCDTHFKIVVDELSLKKRNTNKYFKDKLFLIITMHHFLLLILIIKQNNLKILRNYIYTYFLYLFIKVCIDILIYVVQKFLFINHRIFYLSAVLKTTCFIPNGHYASFHFAISV